MEKIGSWVTCDPQIAHKGVQVMFFKTPEYKYPFCDMCLESAQKRNGTLPISYGKPINHRPDSKPEKDTL